VRSAWVFLVLLAFIGLGVLLALPFQAQLVALASLLLVAAYPFMKRLTWWPQAWLGLTFNWGVPVGWAAADPALRADMPVMLLVYAAAIAWTLGYDSIYAAQDMEDDALAGVKSSARALGARLKPAVWAFYAITLKLLAIAILVWTGDLLLLVSLVPAALHFAWQVLQFRADDTASALRAFRSNQLAGLLLVLPLLLAALAVRA
jgi:4-hydroxybenzoate polyprenyltransferase